MQTKKGSRIMITEGMLYSFSRDFQTENHSCNTFEQYVQKRLQAIMNVLNN